jgi:amino-acid N-acetyltransferase
LSAATDLTLRTGTEADMECIGGLLERSGLPTSDLRDARPDFVVASRHGEVIGCGALECFGSAALLRSVAVEPSWRGCGAGRLIVEELERRARAAGVAELVLLTLTARDFFERLGYAPRDRAEVPAAVLDSAEFRSLCPASAVSLGKRLTPAKTARP